MRFQPELEAFREIEIVNDARGKPEVQLYDHVRRRAEEHGIERIHVSLTHTASHAAAVVILETREGMG